MVNNNLINLKENVNHGDFLLPFTVYSGNLSNIYEDISIHWHEEIEILLVEDGVGSYMIDLVPMTLHKGDLILIHPHTLHSGTHISGKNMKWSSMVYNLNMLKSASTDGTLIKYIAPIINKEHTLPTILKADCQGYSLLVDTFKDTLNCYTLKSECFELEIKSLLFKFISLLYKNNLIQKDSASSKLSLLTVEKIKIVLNYIHSNYPTEISISDLAKLCGFSDYYFMRFFKKYLGMSSIQYLNAYRLEKASQLLNNTEMSVMDISLEVGFDSLSYFIKLFKRKYNLTPLEFKKVKR